MKVPEGLYGPDKPCRRTACLRAVVTREYQRLGDLTRAGADRAQLEQQKVRVIGAEEAETADHVGGEHLNPHNRALFDGNSTSIIAATYRVKSEVSALDQLKPTLGDLTPSDRAYAEEVIDAAIRVTLREIDFQRDQATQARVDADNKVREASKRALDCADHGRVIAELEGQVGLFESAERRSNDGRLALLGFLTAVDDFTRAFREGRTRTLSPEEIVTELEKVSRKAHAAHSRAWSDKPKRAKP